MHPMMMQAGNSSPAAQQFHAFWSNLSPQDQKGMIPMMLECVEGALTQSGGDNPAEEAAEVGAPSAAGAAPAGTDNEDGESMTTPVAEEAEPPVRTPFTSNSNSLRIGNKTY